jgi:hypothetical protein
LEAFGDGILLLFNYVLLFFIIIVLLRLVCRLCNYIL